MLVDNGHGLRKRPTEVSRRRQRDVSQQRSHDGFRGGYAEHPPASSPWVHIIGLPAGHFATAHSASSHLGHFSCGDLHDAVSQQSRHIGLSSQREADGAQPFFAIPSNHWYDDVLGHNVEKLAHTDSGQDQRHFFVAHVRMSQQPPTQVKRGSLGSVRWHETVPLPSAHRNGASHEHCG